MDKTIKKIDSLIDWARKERDCNKLDTKDFIYRDGYLDALKDIKSMLETKKRSEP